MAKHETQTGLTQDRQVFFPPAAASPGDADYCLAIRCIPPLQMSQMIDNLHSWMGVGGRIIGYLPI